MKNVFYTSDPNVLEDRIRMIEDSIDRAESGFDDSNKWIQIDDFMATMRREFSWL